MSRENEINEMFIHSKGITFWNLNFVTKNNFRGIRMGIWPILGD